MAPEQITGWAYSGRKIKLTAKFEPVDNLIELGRHIRGSILWKFQRKYGNILDLLYVPTQVDALTTLGQFWDTSLRCFTFPDFQIAPTLEEYGALLRIPLEKNSTVYHYPGHMPSQVSIAKLLNMGTEEIHLVSPGQVSGISRKMLEGRLKMLAERKEWDMFNRVFALIIYGVILFPFSFGIIDLAAIGVFQMVEYQQINPVPAILAETYLALNRAHAKRGGKMTCCLPLLYVWMLSHFGEKNYSSAGRHDECSNPILLFKKPINETETDQKDWERILEGAKAQHVRWRLNCWYEEEFIYRCGDFLNVPLMGPRGSINYNPALMLRQFGFCQGVPAEETVLGIQYSHDEPEAINLNPKFSEAWSKVIHGGKAEFGKRIISATFEYQEWLQERILGRNPTFAPPNPMMREDFREINAHLDRQLEKKNEELEELKTQWDADRGTIIQVQGENIELKRQITELRKRKRQAESQELNQLREENAKLTRATREAHSRIKQTKQQVKDSKARSMKVNKEKDAEYLELRREITRLNEELQKKMTELSSIRSDASATIQDLAEQLDRQAETTKAWQIRCSETESVARIWMVQFQKMIVLMNEFAEALTYAEGMANPLHTPIEMSNFFSLCRTIIATLKGLARH